MQETYVINHAHQAELEKLLKTELSSLPFSLRDFIAAKSEGSTLGATQVDIMLLWIERKNELIKTYGITEPESQWVIYCQSISTIDWPKELKQYVSERTWSSYADLEKLIVQWIVAARKELK